MRQFLSIFLLLSLFGPLIGAFGVLHYKKMQVRRYVKRQVLNSLNKSELTLLKFSIEEVDSKLEWEHSREFEYNGQMFDVVESKSIGDTIYYYCYNDSDETLLNKKLESLMEETLGKNTDQQKKHKVLISFLKGLYCYSNSIGAPQVFNEVITSVFSPTFLNYKSFILSPQGPPPRAV